MSDLRLLLLGAGVFVAAILFLFAEGLIEISVRNTLKAVVSLLCLATVVGRWFVPHVVPSLPGTYEALAHVFCGILLGVWLAGRDRFYILLLLIITVFEGAMFLLTR